MTKFFSKKRSKEGKRGESEREGTYRLKENWGTYQPTYYLNTDSNLEENDFHE